MRLAAGTQINFEKDIHSVATLDLGKHLFYEKSVISLSFDLAPMRKCSINNAFHAREWSTWGGGLELRARSCGLLQSLMGGRHL